MMKWFCIYPDALFRKKSNLYVFANVNYFIRSLNIDSPRPRLSPNQVTEILICNEFSRELKYNSVKSFEGNLLPSNIPPEDRHIESRSRYTTGMLFGVFDGHGGNACVEVVSKRLFHYIAASLLSKTDLEYCISKLSYVNSVEELGLLEVYTPVYSSDIELEKVYKTNFLNYIGKLFQHKDEDFNMKQALEKSFLSLDNDLSSEAINKKHSENEIPLAVALSGCVACVAHIDGLHLHVANVGDCKAVIGQESDNHWAAKVLTSEHNNENTKECERILKEHPDSEKMTIITEGRLLGQLAPLRAFGDFRYKWNRTIQEKVLVPFCSSSVIPPNLLTPPYLTACPEFFYHKLTSKDKFLILASDGLWEFLSPAEVVALIGEHMFGRTALNPLILPKKTILLGHIEKLLIKRREAMEKKPTDANAATHLIRHALSSTDYGFDHVRLSTLLSFPEDIVRSFRDDITVTIIFFDADYISRSPI